jgi:hypothetical protein
VHLRRATILFALVLGLTALAAAVSPSRDSGEAPSGSAAAPPAAGSAIRELVFQVRASGAPRVRAARAGEHLSVSVGAAEGGLVTIPRLGRTATVAPAAPAVFDLLAPAPGRYDLLFAASSLDEPRRVGTIVVRP